MSCFVSLLRTCSLFLVVAIPCTVALGDIVGPGGTVPGVNGDVFTWDANAPQSTFSVWNSFAPPNPTFDPPNIVFPGDQFAPNLVDAAGLGAANALTVNNGGTIVTGSGNLYSFATVQDFTSSINPAAPNLPGDSYTRIVAQFKTFGTEFDYGSIRLDTTLGSLVPLLSLETGRQPDFGFGIPTEEVTHLALWDVAETTPFELSLTSQETSLALKEFRIDTFTQSSPFDAPSAVPEPGSWLMLSLLGISCVTWLRCRRKSDG